MAPKFITHFEESFDGKIEVSERCNKPEGAGFYDSTYILKTETQDIAVSVWSDEESDTNDIIVGIHESHIKHPDNDRVFHVHLAAKLNLAEAERLYAYLGFLIAALKGAE